MKNNTSKSKKFKEIIEYNEEFSKKAKETWDSVSSTDKK